MRKWLIAGFLVVVASAVALVLLSSAGIVRPEAAVLGALKRIPATAKYVKIYELGLKTEAGIEIQNAELESKRESIEREAAELSDERRRLEKLRSELEVQTRQIERERAELERRLERLKEAEQRASRISDLASIYASMEPAKAGQVLSALSDEEAIAILRAMEASQAGAIFEAMEPKRAARLSALMMK